MAEQSPLDLAGLMVRAQRAKQDGRQVSLEPDEVIDIIDAHYAALAERTALQGRVAEMEAKNERNAGIAIEALKSATELKQERDALQEVFDLRWDADQRAIKRWQDAGENRDLTWPDHADLVVWSLESLATRDARVAELESVNERLRKERGTARGEAHACHDEIAALNADVDAFRQRAETAARERDLFRGLHDDTARTVLARDARIAELEGALEGIAVLEAGVPVDDPDLRGFKCRMCGALATSRANLEKAHAPDCLLHPDRTSTGGWREPAEIERPSEGAWAWIYVVHPLEPYRLAGEKDRWRAVYPAQWTEHNDGGWVWHGMLGKIEAVQMMHAPALPTPAQEKADG